MNVMDGAILEQQDGFSDYGSDFTPDEEEVLNILLQQVPGKRVTESNLLPKDFEYDEGAYNESTGRAVLYRPRAPPMHVQTREESLSVSQELDYDGSTIGELVDTYQDNTK